MGPMHEQDGSFVSWFMNAPDGLSRERPAGLQGFGRLWSSDRQSFPFSSVRLCSPEKRVTRSLQLNVPNKVAAEIASSLLSRVAFAVWLQQDWSGSDFHIMESQLRGLDVHKNVAHGSQQ